MKVVYSMILLIILLFRKVVRINLLNIDENVHTYDEIITTSKFGKFGFRF